MRRPKKASQPYEHNTDQSKHISVLTTRLEMRRPCFGDLKQMHPHFHEVTKYSRSMQPTKPGISKFSTGELCSSVGSRPVDRLRPGVAQTRVKEPDLAIGLSLLSVLSARMRPVA
jgi:hypothetical protein